MKDTTCLLDKIPQSSHTNYNYDFWANGKAGFISDDQGTCVYRFHETDRDDNGHTYELNKDENDCPVVAVGIVAYWLKHRKSGDRLSSLFVKPAPKPMFFREQFDNYTELRFNQFKENNLNKPESWNWDWDFEFYVKYIIPHEISLNKTTKALFEYVTEQDVQLVRDVMACYIDYLKTCRSEKGYNVNPEWLVLRGIESYNTNLLEDLEDFEITALFDKLEEEGCIRVAWTEGRNFEGVRLLDRGRARMKKLENDMRKKDTVLDARDKRIETLEAENNELRTKLAALEDANAKPKVDEGALRSYFNAMFNGEIRNHDDKMPYLLGAISHAEGDIDVGRIALQIYKSKYFLKKDSRGFMPWYREFCRIIGRKANESYNRGRFETDDSQFLSTMGFLNI